MTNNTESQNTDNIIQKRETTLNVIKHYWASAVGCTIGDFERGITYIPDSSNQRLADVKIPTEIYTIEFVNGGTIIGVPDECIDELKEIIERHGLHQQKMGELLLRKYGGHLTYPAAISLYLFDTSKLLPIAQNIRNLEEHQCQEFQDFMNQCSEEDKKEVYMDFMDPFHVFYAYHDGSEIVAIGNYCRNNDSDKVAHIGILVRTDLKGRGYGKLLANTMTHKILEQGLIPQYRVDPKNIASRSIAKNLGYEEVLSGYSLRVKQNNT